MKSRTNRWIHVRCRSQKQLLQDQMDSVFFMDEMQIKQLDVPDLKLSLIVCSVFDRSEPFFEYTSKTERIISVSLPSFPDDSSSLESTRFCTCFLTLEWIWAQASSNLRVEPTWQIAKVRDKPQLKPVYWENSVNLARIRKLRSHVGISKTLCSSSCR